MDLSELSIVSAHEVREDALYEFYRTQYPGRALAATWKWVNRASFGEQRIPLAVLYRGRMIAHAGAMPFHVVFKGATYTASWYIDFAVVPEFQRQGVGILLTKRWMDHADLYVAFANERSIGVLKKYGWVESFDTYLHCYLLRPLDHPKFHKIPAPIRAAAALITSPLLWLRYRACGKPVSELRLNQIDERSLESFVVPQAQAAADTRVHPIRDGEYIAWRLLGSPARAHYRVASLASLPQTKMVVKLCQAGGTTSIDILLTSPAARPGEVRALVATLAQWGIGHRYAYLRLHTCSQPLSQHLSRSLTPVVRHPRYAYYSRNVELFSALQQASWEWELIDCDFEMF